ncbi:MAG: prolipoprotein diacylglyceryl transferase [Acidimicrobiales bacterium]
MLAAISYEPLVRIHLGPLAISPHGIGIALGFLAGAWLTLPAARKRGIGDEVVYTMLTRSMVGAIIGARFFYVLNNLSSFESPVEWFKIWEGGISLLGGIFGAVVACLPVVRHHRFRFFQVMDAVAPGIALGIMIGRIGDLVIADHLGEPTSFFLGFRCPDRVDVGETVGSSCPPGQVVHHTALYDLIVVTLVLGLLLWYRRRDRAEGQITLLAAMAYGTGRFVFDFVRADVRRLGLTGSQWVAVVVVVIAAVLFLQRRRARAGGDGEGDVLVAPGATAEAPGATDEGT